MLADFSSVAAVILIIAFIFWLSHRQIRTSSRKQDDSEHVFEDERNGLERRVSDRTDKLIKSEMSRLEELERIAEFGKLSQGLFHDLMSPLSAISLYIEELSASGKAVDASEAEAIVSKTVRASDRMRSYMESVRRCLGSPNSAPLSADLAEEIYIVRDLLAYKARMAGTSIKIGEIPSVRLPIHPIRLHQVFLNLISNAIDACEKKLKDAPDQAEKSCTVSVSAMLENSTLIIRVADDGCGMTADELQNLFTKRFTTKKSGSGMGLMTVKNIVEKELGGKIEVKSGTESDNGTGTTFTLWCRGPGSNW